MASVRIARARLPPYEPPSPAKWRPIRFRSEIELAYLQELIRFPATPYLYRVEDDGTIEIDPEVSAELTEATARARQEIVRRLARTPRKEIYLFVHGVATEFDEAVLLAAEFWHFLGREGIPIAYTWPAGGKSLFFYTIDRESGEFTVLHLKQVLQILASIPEIEKIHISAHSRGTDVAMTALRELIIESRAAGTAPREQLKIDNVVLAAADMDLEVVMQRIVGEAMGPAFGRVTIYANAKDTALSAAQTLFRSRQRLGSLTPSTLSPHKREILRQIANLDIVVYEGSAGGLFRHGYFRDPAVSSDVVMVLRYGWRPGEQGRAELERIDDNIWRITDDYLARDEQRK